MSVGLKYRRANRQHKLGRTQQQRGGRRTVLSFTRCLLSLPLSNSRGSGLAHTEAEL